MFKLAFPTNQFGHYLGTIGDNFGDNFRDNFRDNYGVNFWNFFPILKDSLFLGTTVRDFTQMNELCEKYGDKLVILAFPTNQFGHQENSSGQEIINALKYVRPGNGFQPKCIMFDKVSITG